jgi:putative peptidoglycan lipid II flippase
LELRSVLSTIARLGVAALLAGVPALLTVLALDAALGEDKTASIIQLVLGGLVLVLAYVAAAFALRVREVRQVGSMVRSRLG